MPVDSSVRHLSNGCDVVFHSIVCISYRQVVTKLGINQLFPSSLALSILGALDRLFLGGEVQTDAVDTVTLICGCGVALSLKYMTKMAAAVGADDLSSAHAQSAVFMACNGTRDAVKVCRPATARLELVIGLVDWGFTPSTGVDSRLWHVLVVLSRKGGFGALLSQNTELF